MRRHLGVGGIVAQAGEEQLAEAHGREGYPGAADGGPASLGRREPHRVSPGARVAGSRVAARSHALLACPRGPGDPWAGGPLRLHQRLPRHRQRDRDLGQHPGPEPASGDRHERHRQLRRGADRDGRGQDDRRRADRAPGRGQVVVAAALVGAIVWNLLTWRLGIPSLEQPRADRRPARRTIAAAIGFGAWQIGGILGKVILPLIGSPIVGLRGRLCPDGGHLQRLSARASQTMNDRFRRLQVLSAAFMAFSHGSNDAQKTMGVMTLALVSAGSHPGVQGAALGDHPGRASAISLGTAAGGWRIIRTMGSKVVKLDPVHGFAAETTAATIIFGASHAGDAGEHDPRHLERHPGGRLRPIVLGGSLGRCRRHRDRLGPDHPRGRRRRGLLPAPPPFDPRLTRCRTARGRGRSPPATNDGSERLPGSGFFAGSGLR